ncbi:hypothetical protein HMPREF9720_1951 [Alistipes sp. HGB5]|nr:hypothetical protein HMPREF9720_1951 [Alistipes sp. HGB5]
MKFLFVVVRCSFEKRKVRKKIRRRIMRKFRGRYLFGPISVLYIKYRYMKSTSGKG